MLATASYTSGEEESVAESVGAVDFHVSLGPEMLQKHKTSSNELAS